ncbi:TIGR03560 family F420-dependent LLM class oxidoreductase [Jonesia quinghaiensis]|uniref:TIGR03560 family F420-dependent LLM class oxidoreductase n=1 Tax=Jonesia quinghaiensis TaxID=262806 RepID=UPI0004024ABE|nr:TIGR03560 family F420-dependent LLM class oxidoreductase [Jonesia quinghaiensis]
MDFGLFIPQGWRQDLTGIPTAKHWPLMKELAQRADRGSAFSSIWVYDHMHTVPEPVHEATHEAWSLMSGFAAVTDRVALGQMCTCMAYRNPAHLAKVATTTDIISGGRVQMGIGAGWYEHEWRAYGYGFPGAGERLAALDEGVQIMRDLFSTGTATFTGKHYQVDGALNYPLPTGKIPLWIAGGGEKKTLKIAAKYADYTNFDGNGEEFSRKSAILAEHCKQVGRDFGSITRSANYNVVIGETAKEVQDRLDWYRAHLATTVSQKAADDQADALARGPLVGTPELIVERLQDMQQRGMTYAITYFAEAAYDTSGLEMFETQVVPHLK